MKVKVIKRYVDKNTKQMMEVGTKKDYPEERASELIKSGRVEVIRPAENGGGYRLKRYIILIWITRLT